MKLPVDNDTIRHLSRGMLRYFPSSHQKLASISKPTRMIPGKISYLRLSPRGNPGRRSFRTHNDVRNEIVRLVRYYERQTMPRSAPRIKIMFVNSLPYDVLGEMQPYYDVRDHHVVKIELRLNSPFIAKNIDQISKGDLRGLIAHEICHAKHSVAMFKDYMKQKNPHADIDVYKPCMCQLRATNYRLGTHPGLIVRER